MAVYKVPQDVEAEDKLLGPFTFRQFIYLIVAAMAAFLAYGLWQLFWGLGLLPGPVIAFFLVLALPIKKDQPMETYLTAIVRFLLKPRLRMWDPEGNFDLVEITAVRTQEGPALKEFSGQEASERLRYLSQVVDTGGWASRGLTSPLDNIHLSDTFVAEAQSAEDMFDTTGNVSQNFDTMISRSDQARKQAMIKTMHDSIQNASQPVQPAQTPIVQVPSITPAQPAPAPEPIVAAAPVTDHVAFNPYPSSMHQKVISPSGPQPTKTQPLAQTAPAQKQPQASSEEAVSPDIMRLATSKDLSISTIAREAERLQKKHLGEEEVVVSLR